MKINHSIYKKVIGVDGRRKLVMSNRGWESLTSEQREALVMVIIVMVAMVVMLFMVVMVVMVIIVMVAMVAMVVMALVMVVIKMTMKLAYWG